MVLSSYELYAVEPGGERFLRLITCANDTEAFTLAGELAASGLGAIEVRRGGEPLFTVADGPRTVREQP